jgi:hypothetical protein
MSALPPKADTTECCCRVRFGPKADIRGAANVEQQKQPYSITSSAAFNRPIGTLRPSDPPPTLDRPGGLAQNKPGLKISRRENSLVSWAASAGAQCSVSCPNGGSHDPQVDGSFAPANEIGRGRITNGPHSNLRPRRHERRTGARLRRSQTIQRHRGRSVLCLYPIAEVVRGLPRT